MKILQNSKMSYLLAGALLAAILAAATIAWVIREKQKKEIEAALLILRDSRQPVNQVENTLEALFMAENEFKEYTLSYEQEHFINYRKQLERLVNHIDTLQTMMRPFGTGEGKSEARQIISEREREAGAYIRLKRLTDSIMVIAATIDSFPITDSHRDISLRKIKPRELDIDTLAFSRTKGYKTKGLLGKIKTFLVGEEVEEKTEGTVVVKPEETAAETEEDSYSLDQFAADVITRTDSYYQAQLKNQLKHRNELRQSELRLIKLNNALMSEIRGILFTMKASAMSDENSFVKQSTSNITRSAGILYNSLLAAVIAALLLALATAWMLRENNRYQIRLLESGQQALAEAEEKRRFLTYMSHEFRTPLSSVIGFAEQLEQSKPNAEQREYLDGILSSSEILLTTVNDILDLSKLDAGKMTFLHNPFRPSETLKQAVKSFDSMIRDKKLKISVKSPDPSLVVVGDEVRLRQVINNLVSNAVKYTLKGSIGIESRVAQTNGTTSLTIRVEDSGMGIAAGQIDKIFDEYTRVYTDNTTRWIIGTGLGLPVTKKLIDEMGGTIEVQSKAGKGSVFTFTIPYETGTMEMLPLAGAETAVLPEVPDARILIADDNYFNVQLLKSIFRRTGAWIEAADNGEEALKKALSGEFDLLLSDMFMPGIDGLELTRRIRAQADDRISRLPVIMITGNVSQEASAKMKEAGVSDFLFKPFQQKDLIEMAGKYLTRTS